MAGALAMGSQRLIHLTRQGRKRNAGRHRNRHTASRRTSRAPSSPYSQVGLLLASSGVTPSGPVACDMCAPEPTSVPELSVVPPGPAVARGSGRSVTPVSLATLAGGDCGVGAGRKGMMGNRGTKHLAKNDVGRDHPAADEQINFARRVAQLVQLGRHSRCRTTSFW
jgi:hypothetical protein